ncbi:MAG: hypothetical protein CL608_28755 [Anaerolineaceae bacterium]|nr:hypothetical protein [Anaerolineaceae bacterium]
MNQYVVTENIEAVFTRKVRVPTTLMWNRLEGRPRRPDFTRALQAEVRDPLWLLARQWQMGEFIAEDAGSPLEAKVAWTTDEVTELHMPGGAIQPYNPDLPLEAVIEARDVPLALAGRLYNTDLRLAIGRRWKRMLTDNGHSGRMTDFRDAYPFIAPDQTVEADNAITAHAAAWQMHAAIAGRAIDGGALVHHLLQPGALASDGLSMVDPEKSAIDTLGDELLNWAQRQFLQPDESLQAWNARHLAYSLALSAPSGEQPAALEAAEYRGGRMDWFNFDAVAADDSHSGGAPGAINVSSFMPATIQFDGMPNTRHWAFEEAVINFGDIDPDTTDIAKLLLIEFGLVYANDWFLMPIDLPVGSLTGIQGIAVTNVFGERFWIEPAVDPAGPTQSWQMFRLTDKGASDGRLFLPATTPAGLESEAVERVSFVRDEISNMVWAIETIVQLSDGQSRQGRQVALELHGKYQSAITPPPPAPQNDAKVQYTLMTSVAEHWIPFIPVHLENDNHEIQLQRAAMPRLLEGQVGIIPEKIAPRTRLVRVGLETEPGESYYIAEEEVERAGTVVETKWQRCRWRNGAVVLWQGHHRQTGRGGASTSGLAFDTLVQKQQSR